MTVVAASLAAVGVAAAAVDTPEEDGFTTEFHFDECDGFSSKGENLYFNIEPGTRSVLEGRDEGERVKVKIEVTGQTRKVNGVETRVVKETETKDGELAEISRNYYAICERDNSVVYFGEDVKLYEDGEVVDTDGSWLAGRKGAKPGIIMPGTVLVGSKYFQELAPGVALDRAEHLRLDAQAHTPEGDFDECLEVEETTPLESGKGLKKYALDVGLVEDGPLKLTETNAD